jgi:hypothetical protein
MKTVKIIRLTFKIIILRDGKSFEVVKSRPYGRLSSQKKSFGRVKSRPPHVEGGFCTFEIFLRFVKSSAIVITMAELSSHLKYFFKM